MSWLAQWDALHNRECTFEDIIRSQATPRWFLYAFALRCIDRVEVHELLQRRSFPPLVQQAVDVARSMAQHRVFSQPRDAIRRQLDAWEQATSEPQSNALLRCLYWLMTEDAREGVEMSAWVAAEYMSYSSEHKEEDDPQQAERSIQRKLMLDLFRTLQQRRCFLLQKLLQRKNTQERVASIWREDLEDAQY